MDHEDPPAYEAPESAGHGRFEHLPLPDRLLLARALDDGRPVEIDYRDSGGAVTTRGPGAP